MKLSADPSLDFLVIIFQLWTSDQEAQGEEDGN